MTNILLDLEALGLPEFVKTASADEIDEKVLQTLDGELFADYGERKYPIHTKAAAYVSNVRYWQDTMYGEASEHQPFIARQLLEAAEHFKIASEVHDALAKIAAQHEMYFTDIPDASFALVVDAPGSTKQKMFPVLDAETTKKAAVDFYNARHKLPYAMRKTAAQKIGEKMASYGVILSGGDAPVSAYLEALNANCGAVGGWASDALQTRAMMLQFNANPANRELVPELEKTAALIRNEELSPEAAEKVAQFLDDLDMQTGLYLMYGGATGLPLPEDSLKQRVTFAKTASEVPQRIQLKNGLTITHQDLTHAGPGPFDLIGRVDDVYADGVYSVELAAKVASQLDTDMPLFSRALESALACPPASIPERRGQDPIEPVDAPLAGALF